MHSDNVGDVEDFMLASLELGGFPLVDPVFEDNAAKLGSSSGVTQAMSLQRQLMTINFYSYKQNVLHLLAQKRRLDEKEREFLGKFLAQGNLQRINLWQKDYLSKDPLSVAIETQNTDFIKIVAASDASLDKDWKRFFDLSSFEFNQVLVSQFTPTK